jgi:hypothetical protein
MSETFSSELPVFSNRRTNRRTNTMNAMPNETDPKGGPRNNNKEKPAPDDQGIPGKPKQSN